MSVRILRVGRCDLTIGSYRRRREKGISNESWERAKTEKGKDKNNLMKRIRSASSRGAANDEGSVRSRRGSEKESAERRCLKSAAFFRPRREKINLQTVFPLSQRERGAGG